MDPIAPSNIVDNPVFQEGLRGWKPLCCKISVLQSPGSVLCERWPDGSGCCCVATNRTAAWQGMSQEIQGRLRQSVDYDVQAVVTAVGQDGDAPVIVTLKLEDSCWRVKYIHVAKASVSVGKWTVLEGKLRVESSWPKALLYVEGPPRGVSLLLARLSITPASGDPVAVEQEAMGVTTSSETREDMDGDPSGCTGTGDILKNWNFQDGLESWTCNGCKASFSKTNSCVDVSCRRAEWQGIQQDVTRRLKASVVYDVSAVVRLHESADTATVLATLHIVNQDGADQYISMGRTEASTHGWVELKGKLTLNKLPSKAIAYLEGPPSGVDLSVRSFSMRAMEKPTPANRPVVEDPRYGINIVENSTFSKGLASWYALGSCHLEVTSEGARGSRCVVATQRHHYWEGPAQNITDRVRLFLTYEVRAWVRVRLATEAQKVNVALGVDDAWVNGGDKEADASDTWTEVRSSFRLEKEAKKVVVYVQGPAPGTSVMVAGLQIVAVDKTERLTEVIARTDEVRKREVMLTVKDRHGRVVPSRSLQILQTRNDFPLGSCINRHNIDNPGYVKFFLEQFNWAVFENEMKWTWIEPSQGKLHYKEADELLEFCSQHSIPVRGHCVFWEVEHTVQEWLKCLPEPALRDAVQRRVKDLLSRYQGRVKHYDVNNEMLHGSFFKDRLGHDIIPHMFRMCKQLDPHATLFVNDYHVEDGCDANSSAQKYVDHVLKLQRQGAPVGGVGVQGHIDAPVGSILRESFDVLSSAGLPIWLTEVDVASSNEHIRADDLEVVLREAYAHPGVEGVLLWGFWEGAMFRQNAHLVNWDSGLTEAGKRFLALKREWLTKTSGMTNAEGQMTFRGFTGQYAVSVAGEDVQQAFDVRKGAGPLKIDITLTS